MSDLLQHFLSKYKELQKEEIYQARCPYCSVQCSKEVIEERIVSRKQFKVNPNKEDPTSEGRLCIKGMHAHQHVFHKDRVLYPMLKVDGEFVRVSWCLALDYIKEKFHQIQLESGNDGIGVYGGGSLTNEESYLLGKFARVALKTKYIDYNGRFCMSSAAAAGNIAFGIDRGLTMKLSDIQETECLILAGTNIAECQPTLMPYIRKAKKNGCYIIAIDPRETATTKLADLHIKVKPGMDANLVNGILKFILERGFVDQEFVQNRTNGYEELKDFLECLKFEELESITNVTTGDMELAAEKFGKANSAIVLTARGVEQHSTGVETVKSYINLTLVTGKIGKPGCGYGAVTGQANGQGGREHGQKADQLPGYRLIENKEHREYIASVWGIEESELPRKGVSAYEMMEKINEQEIKGLFLMASNPVVSNPNAILVEKALKKLDFLVVVDMYISETARMADLILPTSSYLEDTGTITNLEGRVVLREGEREKPGETKHDWEILCDIADTLGSGQYFSYSSPEEIFEELRKASKGGIADYYGITYARLKEGNGIHWPCPEETHPGTERLFGHHFAHRDWKATISTVPIQKPNETIDEEFPLFLTTGRVLHHYLTGVQTRKSSKLFSLCPEPLLEIHPETAQKYGIADKSLVQVQSKRGNMVVRAAFKESIRRDTLFTSFHWGDIQSVNRVTNPALDPLCRMPEFKVSAVKVSSL
ncbi:assimilatory nitrate reductase catalytic subunit NasC [Bacillus sp. Marseille-P3661]|uniref:assimilatory nitrate reductase catalytic subunit NasC n=1 Tax=Bacillus sp. Marseille-P3661 TaxID=1936234 RepID=UPI000C863678|nr:nitrate reductase [Bacillus sp. Marseille-P3661]